MAEVKVLIPAVMSSSTNGERELDVNGNTVIEVIDELSKKYGEDFKNKVIDNSGNLKPIINVYVNDENIKFLEDLHTKLKDKDEILFLPAVSGG
ncbi:MAG: molybdopterin synthase sulfur carrier subunit [Thaumarchaeota archaeon]|nr:molybdopterin synthase sulfur carrier subunit [Nitrososphaerota archaeon]|tara:strand:- start:26795 stop:27076 length:282 start_codon:yes stop_codon:yes gene_type:complete